MTLASRLRKKLSFFLSLLASVNLVLFLFNLLPIYPLDGGHVAGALYERLRASVPGVAASIAAWTDDGGWLDELRVHLDRTRTELADWIRRTPGVQAHPGQAGYLAWLDLREANLGDDPAAVLLERGHLAVSPGHAFALPAEQGNGRIRLNHGTSLSLLREALRRIVLTIEGSS